MMPVEPMIWSASSNWSALLRCVMSPVWIMKLGFTLSALILPTASLSVSMAVTLASLSKPTWLSEICMKVKLLVATSAACASSSRFSALGTPPERVQITPVPAHTMHSSAWRRLSLRPGAASSSSVIRNLLPRHAAHEKETGRRRAIFRPRDHGCVRFDPLRRVRPGRVRRYSAVIHNPDGLVMLLRVLACALGLILLAAPGFAAQPARELFGAVHSPTNDPATPIGSYAKGCIAGAVQLPADGPNWQ